MVDASDGSRLGARISLEIDGETYVPRRINENGLIFESIHLSKNQRFKALYARNRGVLAIELPTDAKRINVYATRGFQYLPARESATRNGHQTRVRLELERWVDLDRRGWIAVEEHIHYDRLDPEDDGRWLDMLEAEGLSAAHFMTLKGGMTPGVWSRQYAQGTEGQANNGAALLVPGQEYRDSAQGHINLLGTAKLIEPYSTGGMGWPKVVENYPPLFDVLKEAQSQGGLAGAAHGGTLGKSPTAIADAILGGVDFWEISNGFIYRTENWYRLMNAGIFLPPLAGTDLPNSPARETWQPMLGSIRSFVHTRGRQDMDSFARSLDEGRVFISGGPIIELSANGKPLGEIVRLSKTGETVTVRAALRSPRPIEEFVIVRNGNPIAAPIEKRVRDGINEWLIKLEIPFQESGWIAAWARGEKIPAQGNINVMAHTNAIRIQVGQQPFASLEAKNGLIQTLKEGKAFYAEKGAYKNNDQRIHALELFDRALEKLAERPARD